jgi:3,4-dihydroxy-2-butanone 4-phosphate synthase
MTETEMYNFMVETYIDHLRQRLTQEQETKITKVNGWYEHVKTEEGISDDDEIFLIRWLKTNMVNKPASDIVKVMRGK